MADHLADPLRHLIATLAYRSAKAIRGVPSDFGARDFGPATRRPVQIVAHMADLMTWARTFLSGTPVWKPEGSADWDAETKRFFEGLVALDDAVALSPPPPDVVEKMIQAPLADALTHVGQIAMLRGMAGAAVRPESYARAEIVRGRVGTEQAAPGREFDGDASARR